MFRLQLVLIFSAVSLVALGLSNNKLTKHKANGRIIGGHDANIEDYPYQVALEEGNWGGLYCGGSIISEKFILTTGHCTSKRLQPVVPEEINVRVNSSYNTHHGRLLRVKAIYNNPKFKFWAGELLDYDLSILELAKPLVFGPGVQPIKLIDANTVLEANTKVTLTGWGYTNESSYHTSRQLHVVETTIVSHDECAKIYSDTVHPYNNVSDAMLCAGDVENGGKGPCIGDSGSPLVANGVLVGAVSWSEGCATKGFPSVYAWVGNEYLREFIRNVTGL